MRLSLIAFGPCADRMRATATSSCESRGGTGHDKRLGRGSAPGGLTERMACISSGLARANRPRRTMYLA